MSQRLQHDVALMITEHCIELLVNVLDEEEKLQARDGIYEICLAGMEAYELQIDRMQRRLKPLQN
ncbi:MAG: hypothetical protein ACYC3I_08010 [Gemmataceae bacterium]